MRIAVAAGWVFTGIAATGFAWQMLVPPVHGQPTSVSVPLSGGLASSGLITIPLSRSEAGDRIAVIDPRTRAMAVYQIGRDSIRLESQRPLHWDLQMSGFNSNKGLSPDAVRLGLERRGE